MYYITLGFFVLGAATLFVSGILLVYHAMVSQNKIWEERAFNTFLPSFFFTFFVGMMAHVEQHHEQRREHPCQESAHNLQKALDVECKNGSQMVFGPDPWVFCKCSR